MQKTDLMLVYVTPTTRKEALVFTSKNPSRNKDAIITFQPSLPTFVFPLTEKNKSKPSGASFKLKFNVTNYKKKC